MKTALIIGGSNGIGLGIVNCMKDYDHIFILDMAIPDMNKDERISYERFDITSDDFSVLDKYKDIDTLMITVGFGKLALFKDIPENMIAKYFNVNTIGVIRCVKHFYKRLLSSADFHCGVMVSISGFMSSPFFSLYAATKAALKIFIESVNVEIEKAGYTNKILNVSPGTIKGTHFNGGPNDLHQMDNIATDIIKHLEAKDDLFIPQYEEIYKYVLERYKKDFRAEGKHSYDYKLNSGRIK